MWSAAGTLSRTALWRDGTDRRAMRVYRYSITYLSACSRLLVVEVLVFPFG